MPRRHKRMQYGAVTLLASLAIAPVAVAQAAEEISVNPKKIMVLGDTTVTGTGFAPGSEVHLWECGAKSWALPANPCNTENRETVTATAEGRFEVGFLVEECPEGKSAEELNTIICYIGVPRFSIDTGMLEPFAKIKVVGP